MSELGEGACVTCRHWVEEAGERPERWGQCGKEDLWHMDGRTVKFEMDWLGQWDMWMKTRDTFGCTQHETSDRRDDE